LALHWRYLGLNRFEMLSNEVADDLGGSATAINA